MNIRPTRGKELLLVIDGNKLPCEMEMSERWTPSDLQRKFPTAMVFVRNKNLHNFEWALKGSILWVPYLKKIVVVIEAHGSKAYVYQIYPVPIAASSPMEASMIFSTASIPASKPDSETHSKEASKPDSSEHTSSSNEQSTLSTQSTQSTQLTQLTILKPSKPSGALDSPALHDPTSRTFKMSLLLEGFYLEQIHGVPIVCQYYRTKRIFDLRCGVISESGNKKLENAVTRIYPLVDNDSGFIKMNIAGPDLAFIGSSARIPNIVPQPIKAWFYENQWIELDKRPLFSSMDICKTHCNSVHVLYVHTLFQHHFKNVIVSPCGEKLIGVPFGRPITTNSLRYVYTFFLP